MKYSLKIIKRQRFSFVLPIFRYINDIRLSTTPRNPLVLRSCRYGIIVHRKSFYITSFVWLTGNLFRKDWRIHHALVVQANSTTLETFKIWRKLTQTKKQISFHHMFGFKGKGFPYVRRRDCTNLSRKNVCLNWRKYPRRFRSEVIYSLAKWTLPSPTY